MIELIPRWVCTPLSHYDTESVSQIEAIGKLQAKMNELVADYNKFVEGVNSSITEFIESSTRDYETFKISMAQQFQDFIEIINLKYNSQEEVIERAITEALNDIESARTRILADIEGFKDEVNIVQSTGESDVSVMSQKAVTDITVNAYKPLLNIFKLDASEFQYGYISSSNGGFSESTKHICNPNLKKYPFDLFIKATANYRFMIAFFNDDGTFKTGGAYQTQSFTIPANQAFKISIFSYWGNVEITDFAKYVDQVTMTGNPYANDVECIINNFKHKTPKALTVRGISHTGWNQAPQNTLPAYKEAKRQGFEFAECDIRFTSDNVPVLLHDTTINSVARNTDGSTISSPVNIADITLEQAKLYDFGIYKAEKYAGTKIATLEEFLTLCRNIGLYPYIDIKDVSITEEQANAISEVVKRCGFQRNITLLCWSLTTYNFLQSLLPKARYAFVNGLEFNDNNARSLLEMFNRSNTFLDVDYRYSAGWISFCKEYGIPVEVWTVDTVETLVALDSYITGVTSNTLNAEKTLEEYYLN